MCLSSGESTYVRAKPPRKFLARYQLSWQDLRHLARDLFYLAVISPRAQLELVYLADISFISPRSLWHFKVRLDLTYPGCHRFFSRAARIFGVGRRPTHLRLQAEAAKTRPRPEIALEKSLAPREDLTEISFISERSAPKHAKISARSHLAEISLSSSSQSQRRYKSRQVLGKFSFIPPRSQRHYKSRRVLGEIS